MACLQILFLWMQAMLECDLVQEGDREEEKNERKKEEWIGGIEGKRKEVQLVRKERMEEIRQGEKKEDKVIFYYLFPLGK